MIRTILRGFNRVQITAAFIGSWLGITILLTGIQFYMDVQPILSGRSGIWGEGYHILNKPVSVVNTISRKNATFDTGTVKKLREEPFIKDAAAFRTSNFNISASTPEGGKMPGFYTQLFLEAVPDRLLHIQDPEWGWSEGDAFVPILIPARYLTLYNFGFAQSKGLPQISRATAGAVSFRMKVSGKGRSETFKSRIIAFSERINSILVPRDFLEWANDRFGEAADQGPGRLIIKTEQPPPPELFTLLEEKGYESHSLDKKSSKASTFLRTMTGVVSAIGALFTLLAVFILLISFQLLVEKNRERLRKLFLLGYDPGDLINAYNRVALFFNGALLLVTLLAGWFLRRFSNGYVEKAGFEMEPGPGWFLLIGTPLVLGCIALANRIFLKRRIRSVLS